MDYTIFDLINLLNNEWNNYVAYGDNEHNDVKNNIGYYISKLVERNKQTDMDDIIRLSKKYSGHYVNETRDAYEAGFIDGFLTVKEM